MHRAAPLKPAPATPSTLPEALAPSLTRAREKARRKETIARGRIERRGLQRTRVGATPLAQRLQQLERLIEPRPAPAASAQTLIDATPVRQISDARLRLEQRAVEAVLQGTPWLTAQQVGLRHNPDAANPHAAASRWQQAGRLFAIERAGKRLYPGYAFDEFGQPLPALPAVLQILAGLTPFRLAAWFESTHSMLGGRRPRECLATEPAAVIAAAREQVAGPVHG